MDVELYNPEDEFEAHLHSVSLSSTQLRCLSKPSDFLDFMQKAIAMLPFLAESLADGRSKFVVLDVVMSIGSDAGMTVYYKDNI